MKHFAMIFYNYHYTNLDQPEYFGYQVGEKGYTIPRINPEREVFGSRKKVVEVPEFVSEENIDDWWSKMEEDLAKEILEEDISHRDGVFVAITNFIRMQ